MPHLLCILCIEKHRPLKAEVVHLADPLKVEDHRHLRLVTIATSLVMCKKTVRENREDGHQANLPENRRDLVRDLRPTQTLPVDHMGRVAKIIRKSIIRVAGVRDGSPEVLEVHATHRDPLVAPVIKPVALGDAMMVEIHPGPVIDRTVPIRHLIGVTAKNYYNAKNLVVVWNVGVPPTGWLIAPTRDRTVDLLPLVGLHPVILPVTRRA